MNLQKGVKKLQRFLKRNKSKILTAASVVTTVAAVGDAVYTTVKVVKKVNEFEETTGQKATPKDVVSIAWKDAIHVVALTGVSVGCNIGSEAVNGKTKAALAGALATTVDDFVKYRNQTVAKIGEIKEAEVRQAVFEEKVAEKPIIPEIAPREGEIVTLWEDCFGRQFAAKITDIENAAARMKQICRAFGYCEYNVFYSELDLPGSDLGDLLGFNPEKFHEQIQLKPTYTRDKYGNPIGHISWYYPPRYRFDVESD